MTESFVRSARVFARKWASRLPVATPCALFDREGQVFVLGNAEAGSGSLARPVGPALREGSCAPGKVRTLERGQEADPRDPSPDPKVSAVRGLASIIVPCWNQREFTRLCVQGLLRHTRRPWELIVIDNGSTDGTGDYLAGVQDAAGVPVTIIANARNVGFPRAINQGLQAARGEYLVLLNNDAVVTDAWLDQLIALTAVRVGTEDRETAGSGSDGVGRPVPSGRPAPSAMRGGTLAENGDRHPASADRSRESPDYLGPGASPRFPSPGAVERPVPNRIGLAGPMSNYAAPPQGVESVPYRDLDEMHAFARRWRDRHRGQWFTVGKLSGFCLLLTRAVYDAVGGLDERFGLGLFDDDDLAVRARRGGFELAVAKDLFVHHFGSRTFVGNGVDASALLEENERRFAGKWGQDAPRGRRVELRAWTNPIPDSGFRIPDSGFRIPDSRFRIPDSRFRIPDSRFRILDSRFRIPDQPRPSTFGLRPQTPRFLGSRYLNEQPTTDSGPESA